MTVLKSPLLALALLAAGSVPAVAAVATAMESGPGFDQVIAAPDDIHSNLEYAKAQANQGHLLASAAALERILIYHPDAASVRLVYAVVLYRLDDLQDAQLQLKMIENAQLSPFERKEWTKYTRLVSNARGDSHFNGYLAAGIGYESDAIGALFVQFNNPVTYPREDSVAAVFSGRIDGTTRLGDGDIWLYGSAGGYDQTPLSNTNNEFQNLDAQLGLTGLNLKNSWRIGGTVHHYRLLGADYLTEYGGEAQLVWRPDTRLTLAGSVKAVWQDYTGVPIEALRNGWLMMVQGGVSYRTDALSTFTLSAGYIAKNAKYKPQGYDAPFVQAKYHRLLGLGMYFDMMGQMQWVDYRGIDSIFLISTSKVRKDTDIFTRAAFGVPLSAFAPNGVTGDALENFSLEGAVTYGNRRTENIPLADYNGFGAQIRLIWHFGDDR